MSISPNEVVVTVKMFAIGELGDCFWLKFLKDTQESNMLIDCGSFRNSEKSKKRLEEIVGYIKSELGGKPLDVVVGTHQHMDHLSGFVHCEKMFAGIVNESWLSWLDNPQDSLARAIQRDQKSLAETIGKIARQLIKRPKTMVGETVCDIMGFYATEDMDGPRIPAMGIEVLKKIPEKGVRYLSPGDVLPMPGMPDNSVRVYVLGPPRNQTLLFDKDPKKTETYDPHLCTANVNANRFLAALEHTTDENIDRSEKQFPFNAIHKKRQARANREIRDLYKRETWRTIERDWLETGSRLALYLDAYTNNSSLVLAIELVKSSKVLLFAADAQTGNWLSWYDVDWKGKNAAFSTETLLQNTVLYKVGHHGSHNATLVKALEAMTHPELVAMIPVDKSDPNVRRKENGWKMPAKNLFRRLKEKTGYRVLLMDDGFADGCHPRKDAAKSKWKNLPKDCLPRIDKKNHFIQYTIVG
jgi:beta-lactamase superfamily II metal-dependent hydrolase